MRGLVGGEKAPSSGTSLRLRDVVLIVVDVEENSELEGKTRCSR